jgi:hypothetical protein
MNTAFVEHQTIDRVECNRSSSRNRGMLGRFLRQSKYWVILSILFILSAETTARLDDWLLREVPFFSAPDHDRDLLIKDEAGITRGKPNGRFKKWRLNEFGFRCPEMTQAPIPGRIRIIVLGASESFGLYESAGKEFPAQLNNMLKREGRYDIINAALPGMTVRSMISYWKAWVAQFRPDVVVIYPSPLFYLNDGFNEKPSSAAKPLATQGQNIRSLALRSRLIARLKDMVHVPDVIQKQRDEQTIAARTEGRSEDWYFHCIPEARLKLFASDLNELTRIIAEDGACPVLLTHAMRAMTPPRSEDVDDLRSMRVHLPRATDEVLVDFECAAVTVVRSIGIEKHLPVVDVARDMNGRRHYFADLVHFNDEGASVIAERIAECLRDGFVGSRPNEP